MGMSLLSCDPQDPKCKQKRVQTFWYKYGLFDRLIDRFYFPLQVSLPQVSETAWILIYTSSKDSAVLV